ncbi:MAG: hypothetical protein H7A36_04500 [Chlamydiales bacterium]|nr:hypothetical protein [Chlamydiales bacterium]
MSSVEGPTYAAIVRESARRSPTPPAARVSPAFASRLTAERGLQASSSDQQIALIRQLALKYADPNGVRDRVYAILGSSLSREQKCAELGAIAYLLHADMLDLGSTSPVEQVMAYLRSEMLKRKKGHADCFGKEKGLPSGQMHYLLSTFCEMMLLGGEVNRFAKELLCKVLTSSSVGAFFKEEHADQILAVASQLNAPEIKALLREEFMISAAMELFVRRDLKLEPKASVGMREIRLAALLAAITDLRQGKDGNCYAISTICVVIHNRLHAFLKQTMDILKSGELVSGVRADSFLTNIFEDFSDKFNLGIDVHEHPIVKQLLTLCGVSTPILCSSVKEAIDQIPCSRLRKYARMMISTYHLSCVQQALLKRCELQELNVESGVVVSEEKKNVCEELIWVVKGAFLGQMNELEAPLRAKMHEEIFLADFAGCQILNDTGGYYALFGEKKVKLPITDLDIDEVAEKMSNGRFLYIASENRIVFKMEDLEGVLKGWCRKILNKPNFKALSMQKDLETLMEVFGGVRTKFDFFFIESNGGCPEDALKKTFNTSMSFAKPAKGRVSRITTFLSKRERADQRVVMAEYKTKDSAHAFVLNAHRCKVWAEQAFVTNKLTDPAINMLWREISHKQLVRLKEHITFDSTTAGALDWGVARGLAWVSLIEFTRKIGLKEEELRAIHLVMSEVDVEDLNVDAILKAFGIEGGDSIVAELKAAFPEPALPHYVAYKLRKYILLAGKTAPASEDIYAAICEQKKMPQSIYIGDSNYLADDTSFERPYHRSLYVVCDFVTQSLRVVYQDKKAQYFPSEERFNVYTVSSFV